jgi:hypothetical protein
VSTEPTRVPRCLLSMLAAALVLVLVALGLLLPWLDSNEEFDRQILLRNRQLGGYERQIATLPQLKKALEAMASNPAMDAYYVDAPNPSLGGVSLQRLIERLIADASGNMTSIQILPPKPEGRLTQIGLRLRLTVRAEGLQRILYGIESSQPLLFVDKLNIRSMYRAARRGRQQGQQVVEMNVNLDVYGYIRGVAG